MKKLVVATHNPNKIREIGEILPGWEIMAEDSGAEETADTFVGNARIKAQSIAPRHPGAWVMADDSGLEVEALGGKPGVYSHRYAGEDCNDTANNLKLIEELNGVLNRNANYTCDICYINKDGQVKHSTGKCYGLICNNPKGENGFGYDPYFYIESLGKTMAELDMDEKNKISHRAKALNQLKELIYEDLTSK
jgi:XTP/dITP diphosphohydrolase